jgi:hypothetical protein
MFRQIFESDVLPYRTPDEWAGIPSGIGLGSLYNPYLVTPPRIYAEDIDRTDGMFSTTENGEPVIVVVGWTHMIYWPGWNRHYWKFHGTTGAFISRGDNPASYFDYACYQSTDGSVWRVRITGTFVQIDPHTLEAMAGTERSASEFGAVEVNIPIVDRTNNLMVSHSNLNTSARSICVHNWTTGELIRTISVSGNAINILPEDDHRCYVIHDSGIMNLVDYVSGDVLSTLKTPIALTGDVQYSYELSTRRLLAFEKVADAEDGAGLSVIKGYYPIAIPVALTKPIPLSAIRSGRKTKFICRAIGDVGEPLSGGKITATLDSSIATLSTPSAYPGGDGYAVFTVTGQAEGTAEITTEMTVE